MKNVYSKLQEARVILQEMNIKKSGRNTYSNYSYYELSDYLTHVNKLFLELGLFSQISFTSELATLTIYNTENPAEKVEFTSPMKESNLKGAQEIQNLGSTQTYLRRYLYQTALEIVESDQLDATQGKETSSISSSPSLLSDKQEKMINAKINQLSAKYKLSKEEFLSKLGITDVKKLSGTQAQTIIKKLIELEGK